MTDEDRPAFVTAFTRVALTFRLKMRPAELENLADTYFAILKGYPLDDVVTAGNVCIRSYRRLPKPADWLDLLTRSEVGAPPDVRVMASTEAAEYVRAERLHWDDDEPCDCIMCRAVGITRHRRFVPDFTDDDREERAYCPPKNRTVVVGHWAHGDELVRWYVARDRFFGAAGQAGVHAKVLRRLGFVYTPPSSGREPGCDDD